MSQPGFFPLNRSLRGFYEFELSVRVRTGLLIRKPSQAQLSIGGADVWPMSIERYYECGGERLSIEVPYIPGSSLKGRMRGLLEQALGMEYVTTDGKIFQHVRSIDAFSRSYVDEVEASNKFMDDVMKRCPIDEVFGYASFNYKQHLRDKLQLDENSARKLMEYLAPTRLYVEDLYPDEGYVCELYERLERPVYLSDFLEEKPENRIDRLTAAADPRLSVRVKPGVVFRGRIQLLVYDNDCESCPGGKQLCVERNLGLVIRGLRLVESLGLGAATSRGYGRVGVIVERLVFYEAPGLEGRELLGKPTPVTELEPSGDIVAAACPSKGS